MNRQGKPPQEIFVQETAGKEGKSVSFPLFKNIYLRVCQGCILLPCLFYLYAEDIMQNAMLDSSWNQDCWEKYQ